jgi:hypothetical protein
MLDKIKNYAPHVFSLIASAVFLDSLRYKFTNAPETQVIFGRLDAWAGSFGAGGLFAQTGLFAMAVTVWVGSLTLLIVRRKTLFNIVGGIRDAILTGPDIPSPNAFAKTRIHPV